MRTTLVLPLLAVLAAPASAEETIAWRSDIKPALREAVTAERPLFVDVWAVWCGPCKQMEQTTYRDAKVVAAMDDFVPLKVDQDVQVAFCDRHQVEVLPVVLFLDGDGEEISRIAGLVTAETLVSSMDAVSQGYAAYRQALTLPKDPAALASSGGYLLKAGNPAGAAKLLRRASKALESAPPEQREPVDLELARAQLAEGDDKAATAAFERLADSAVTPAVRGGALEALVLSWRERGDTARANAALEKLRAEFPDRVSD